MQSGKLSKFLISSRNGINDGKTTGIDARSPDNYLQIKRPCRHSSGEPKNSVIITTASYRLKMHKYSAYESQYTENESFAGIHQLEIKRLSLYCPSNYCWGLFIK